MCVRESVYVREIVLVSYALVSRVWDTIVRIVKAQKYHIVSIVSLIWTNILFR